jgi:hypothetical protein
VHTDDIAWWHSFFGWAELLACGVLEPIRRGQAVAFRPPAWDERGRLGAIELPADASLVIVEGVGASRREIVHLLDASVWVQSDAQDLDAAAEHLRAFWHATESLTSMMEGSARQRGGCSAVASAKKRQIASVASGPRGSL